MKARLMLLALCLITVNAFAAVNKPWSVTLINDTNTPVYLTELNHNGAPVHWQNSRLEPGQSEVFNTNAADSVDDVVFGFTSGAALDAKGYYCYRDGRVSALFTGKNNIYPASIKLSDVLNNTTCDESPRNIKALTSNPG